MKLVHRTITFISILFVLFVLKEAYSWYLFANELSEYLGYIYILLLIVCLLYFFIIPIGRLIFLPAFDNPIVSNDRGERKKALVRRLKMMGDKSDEIQKRTEKDLITLLDETIRSKEKKTNAIINTHVFRTFEITSISRSPLIDVITILVECFNVSSDLLEYYGGRLNVKDMIKIIKHSFVSAAFGGSDIVETVVQNTIEVGAKGGELIPFVGPIVGAITDGTVNASLVCRVGLITKYYCVTVFTDEQKDWYPTQTVIAKTVGAITGGVWSLAWKTLKFINKPIQMAVTNLFTSAKKEHKIPEMLTGEENQSWFSKMLVRNKKKKKIKNDFEV
ncbi:MAG: DUF697 domain-containing protein [Candidatus Marinimicrobia bacterium]|nr:DUF697 domain-containing protein [Candidatus Neomarinimicrobiota bacterium]